MRFIGVLIIIVAHASPPDWLFQLRNFGTPLLIVASALTYAIIYENKTLNVIPFIKRRLTRLVIPAWIFLTFFFCIFFLASLVSGKDYPFSTNEILNSYSFYSGIGFVWIFKVYIILTFITPLALKLNKLAISNFVYFATLICLYVLYELVLKLSLSSIPDDLTTFMNTVVFIIIPYSILYLYGIKLGSLSNKKIVGILVCSFIIFILLLTNKYLECSCFISTQEYKYPPTIYYLSYAFFALNLVYIICRNLPQPNKRISEIIIWLSSNSLWIYLWHIMAFYLLHFSARYIVTEGFFTFVLKFCFILIFGMSLTYMQVFLVTRFISTKHVLGRKLISVLT